MAGFACIRVGLRGPGSRSLGMPDAGARGTLASTFVPSITADPLSAFSPAVREWFVSSFAEPTPAQAQAWPAIASGDHVLLSAPTGSGKTLAAFLWAIDRLNVQPPPGAR